jgi:5,6,7,8-tetrahydromethanopterin hydro-lyase
MEIGEAFVGSGAEAAHINTVLGSRSGPVGAAWATSLATPSAGHARFVVVARPGVAVQPLTLFVPKAAVDDPAGTHATLTFGPAQAGVAGGVGDALRDGTIDSAAAGSLVLIAAVWVNPAAGDGDAVFANNREATRLALEAGAAGRPSVEEVLDAIGAGPTNPYWP